MVEEDRGVTDANYVDVVTLTSLPPHLITASVAGRRMFRAASSGSDTVTSLQLARLARPDITRLPWRLVTSRARYTRCDLVEAASLYMGSQLPDIDLGDDQSWVTSLLTRHWLLLSLVLSLLVLLVTPSALSLASCLLLLVSLQAWRSGRSLHKYKVWSQMMSLFTKDLDTDRLEEAHHLRQLSFTFLSVFSLLHWSQALCLPSEPLSWVTGLTLTLVTLLSSLSLRPHSVSLLLGNLVLHLLSLPQCITPLCELIMSLPLSLPSPGVTPELLPLTYTVLVTSYFMASLLTRPTSSVILEIQAFTAENLILGLMLGQSDVTQMFRGEYLLVPIFILCFRHLITRHQVAGLCVSVLLWSHHLGYLDSALLRPQPRDSGLTWASLHNVCPQSGHQDLDQALCAQFSGLQVSWEGRLDTVTVTQTSNRLQAALDLVPEWLQSLSDLECSLGEPWSDCSEVSRGPVERLLCQTRRGVGQCDLGRWAEHSLVMRVTMGDPGASVWGGGGGEVSLSVTGGTELIQRISERRGKQIQFTGNLIVQPLKNIAIEDAIISFGT